MSQKSYTEIQQIVVNDLKEIARIHSRSTISGHAGDGYLTKVQYEKYKSSRMRLKKGGKMLLEAFKLLKM